MCKPVSHASHRFNVKEKEYYYQNAVNSVEITEQIFSDIVQFIV